MLEIKNLTKEYDDLVIDNLSVTFPSTGMVIITGKSGCGKTTLLNIIGGIDLNYQGNIFIDNQNIREIKNYCRKHVGFIFQDFNLINWLNVKNNYLLPGFFTKIIYKRAIEDQEEKLELQKLKRKKVKLLSGGQKQRVALLRAIIKNVDILLCDEPTGSLDQENSQAVFELLKKEAKERLVIVISHDENLAIKYADQLYVMENGKLIKKRDSIKTTDKFYCRLKKHAPANIFKLVLLQYRSNLYRNLKISAGITLAIFCIMITFTLSGSLQNQVKKQLTSIFPNQLISIQQQNHQAINYQELINLKEHSQNQYLYGEPVDYEFIGISLKNSYATESTVYISDMTKKVQSNRIEYGRKLNKDDEIVLTKTTAVHLSNDYQKLINRYVYGYYLKDNQIKKIKLKIVGITDEVSMFDTMYINELANFEHISEIFKVNKEEITTQLVLMNLNQLVNVENEIKNLKEKYSYLDFKVAGQDINANVDNFLLQIQRVLLLFSSLALIAACFLIGEVLYLSVVEKTKDFGIFKCLGASKIQILLLVLLESVILVTVSFVLALILLIQIVQMINSLVITSYSFEGNFVSIDLKLLLVIYLFALGLGILSSCLPAFKASHLDPIKALKYHS